MLKRIFVLALATLMALTAIGCTKAPEDTAPQVKPGTAIAVSKSTGGNPIGGFDADGNLVYGGDPSVLVDGDTLYLYVGHDISVTDSYVIPEYLCYSTKDMVTWTYEGVVLKMSDVKWADNASAWAGQVAKHDGKYYFYYCSWDKTDSGKQSIGVAVADNPKGPFVDIGSALVKGSFTTGETSAWNDIDPTVWIETDEQGVEHRYLSWGNGKLFMCELNEDMISVKDYNGDGQITFGQDVKEKTAPKSFTEAAWIYRRQDENGKHYGDYYIFYAYGWREKMAYATTDDLMNGTVTYQDTIMQPSATSNTNHMAVFDFLGKTWFIYHNGSLPNGSGYRRVACIQELKFNADGSVPYIEETATGATGTISKLTTLKGDVLAHEHYNNSSDDKDYPYTAVKLGSNLAKQEVFDTYWEIVPGKYDPTEGSYVSIESYNKAGLYISYGATMAYMSQDYNGKQAVNQTFKTVMGLAGEGVSFECIGNPGMYLTIVDGKATLTDGSDKEACSFIIETVTVE